MSDQLGPFQDFWEAWNEAHEEIEKEDLLHFRLAVHRQFVELKEHLDAGDREAAAREATDIISISLNLMRWLGYQPAKIAEIARSRAEKRMVGQTSAILDKYEKLRKNWRPNVLTICDEWLPRRGGISQFNRSLTIAAARSGHRTVCLVETASAFEFADATAHGVTLVTAELTPAGPEIYVPAKAVLDINPDVVIGHDIVSGSAAWVYAKRYLQAMLVLIVHTAAAENEPYKRAAEAVRRTEEREQEVRRIAVGSDVVAAVGPRLARRTEALIGDGFAETRVLRLDPGIDLPPDGVERARRVPDNPTVLMLGRTRHIEPKGLDIAARAVARLTVPHGQALPDLLVRGAPDESCAELRRELVQQSRMARDRIDVRPFTTNLDEIHRDLKRSALCVMPSRAEGFGLGALEAIGMGTPVLVSARSGLAETLRERLGPIAEPMIVDVTDDLDQDVPRWTRAMQRVLDDRPAAFAYAHEIRAKLSAVLSWDLTVSALVAGLVPTQRSS